MSKLNEKAIALSKKIEKEIITEISQLASNDIEAYKLAISKRDEILSMSANYAVKINEKRATLEKEKLTVTGKITAIENNLKARRSLEREIVEFELCISELEKQFLPAAEVEIKDAEEKIYITLYDTISKIKNNYQLHLNTLFQEAADIMASFEDAVFTVSYKPEFKALSSEVKRTLIAFDTATIPHSVFDDGLQTIKDSAIRINISNSPKAIGT